MLEILFDFCRDVNHKRGAFFKALLEKNFKFVQRSGSNAIAFHLSFLLLSAKINPFTQKQDHKKDALVAYNIGCIKIILVLLTKVVAFHV